MQSSENRRYNSLGESPYAKSYDRNLTDDGGLGSFSSLVHEKIYNDVEILSVVGYN